MHPQFNSAKDPVIMAGFVAANTLRGEVKTLTGEGIARELAGEHLLLNY